MNNAQFTKWIGLFDPRPPGRITVALYPILNGYGETDALLEMAIAQKWSVPRMLVELERKGQDISDVRAVLESAAIRRRETHEGPIQTSEPELTPLPAESDEKPNFWAKIKQKFARQEASEAPKKGLSRTWGIVIMVVLAVILLAVGYFMFGQSGSGSYDFESQPSFAEPAPSYDPALGFATQTPEESVTRKPEQIDRWQQFVDLNRISSETSGPFLDKPSDWKDIFKRFPTRWFLWIAFLYPIWTLLKQDRLASEEFTDVKAAKRGLLVLFVGVLMAGLLSAGTTYLAANIIGAGIEIPRYFFISMGIVVNLFVQWTAAMNGRKDYSTFSIGGLFFTGVLIVWWFTPNLSMIVLGSLFMAGGIWLQNVEMRRTHQGWAAHVTALVMLLMFALITGLIYFLAGLIPPITLAMPWIQQLLYAAVYSGRLFIGAIIGLMVAFASGDSISTSIMPPSMAGGVSLAGNRSDDDLSRKFDINSRYDAMAYAIMVLYPIATAVWYLMSYFLLSL